MNEPIQDSLQTLSKKVDFDRRHRAFWASEETKIARVLRTWLRKLSVAHYSIAKI